MITSIGPEACNVSTYLGKRWDYVWLEHKGESPTRTARNKVGQVHRGLICPSKNLGFCSIQRTFLKHLLEI